jgi:putative tryptophan/tyrosine transport system substrate-binding protein
MRRRALICHSAALAVIALAGLAPSHAQPAMKLRRIGFLTAGTETARRPLLAALRQGLQQLGYAEGVDFVIEARYAGDQFERLRALADELLQLGVDVIIAATTPASRAAKAATSTTPIVILSVGDPIGTGLIASLSRPGSNITGITNLSAELTGKRLEIIKELVPTASKVALLVNPDDPLAAVQLRNAEAAAGNLKITLGPVAPVRRVDDLEEAFQSVVASGAQVVLRLVDPVESAMRRETAALAAKLRIPVIYPFRESVEAGGLASYGTNLADQYRQAASILHKIFRGENPGGIPLEQPTKFEFVINVKAAKELGLNLAPALLARADAVIE